jgi:hypothetical protein
MRRSDFDVTDTIRTTDAIEVGDEVMRLYRDLYQGAPSQPITRAFRDLSLLYHGKHPDYHPCDTEYHDIQHVLDVTLTMARLLDGYERDRAGGDSLPREYFELGILTALYHDVGYLRRRSDRRHRYGAEYTLTHVSRGSDFLRSYLPDIGFKKFAGTAAQLVHFTGYERKADTIRIDDPLLRRVGEILGTADIVAQMSDRCYLEKCQDRLYPEFVLGGLASRKGPDGRTVTVYASGRDLVSKTPAFYHNAVKRLDQQLHRAYAYADKRFGGQNLYIEEMNKNVKHADKWPINAERDALRRVPPSTLLPGVRPYPEDLVIP